MRISSLAWPLKARRTSARTAWRRSSDLLEDWIFHSKKAWLQQHLPLCFACLQYIKKCLKYLLLWSHASPTRSAHHPPSWCSVPAKRKYRYLMLSSCLSYFREHPFGIHLQLPGWVSYLPSPCSRIVLWFGLSVSFIKLARSTISSIEHASLHGLRATFLVCSAPTCLDSLATGLQGVRDGLWPLINLKADHENTPNDKATF